MTPPTADLERLAATLPTVSFQPMVPPHRDAPPTDEQLAHGISWWPERQVVVVAGHGLVRDVLANPITFSSANAIGNGFTRGRSPAVLGILDRLPPETATVINADDAEHRRLRRIYGQGFTAARVAARLPLMRRTATELVTALRPAGHADLHTAFARPYLAAVVNDLFGYDQAHADRVDAYCDAVNVLLNPLSAEADQLDAAYTLVDAYGHIDGLLADRATEQPHARRPDERDLLYDLAHARGSDRLDRGEQFWHVVISRVAAEETTRYLLLSTVAAMLRSGHWHDARAATPDRRTDLASRCVEETLRAHSPHRGLLRVTSRRVWLGGYELPTGTPLVFAAGAANLDPTAFDDPERFDPHRPDLREHLAFGHGVHRCPGDTLARTEVLVAIHALMELPGLCLDDPDDHEQVPSLFFAGPARLCATWDR